MRGLRCRRSRRPQPPALPNPERRPHRAPAELPEMHIDERYDRGQRMSSQADGAIPASREASHPIDAVAAVAAISIGLGWFVLSTFVTEVGNLSLRFHFYDL